VVTAAHAAELKEIAAKCDHPCPRLACAPPRGRIVPACRENRCVADTLKVRDE
jgi:hypothetical protein